MNDRTLYSRARQMVKDRGGLTPTMISQLREAGYTPGFIGSIVKIWRSIP